MAESGDNKPVRKSRRNVCKEANAALDALGSPMRLAKVRKLHPKEEAPMPQPVEQEVMGDISWSSLVIWGILLVAGGWLLAMLFFRGGASAEVGESAASMLTNLTGGQ